MRLVVTALAALATAASVTGCERGPAPAGAGERPSFLLVSLPSLGTAMWRCGAEEDTYGLAFRVFPGGATTELRLSEGRRVVRRVTVQPGELRPLPLLGLSQRLELMQSTGAGTVEASVSVRFDRDPVVSHCFVYSPPHLAVRVTPRR
jgi:hypothetical protein